VSAASLPQYLSAVTRYLELAGVASPTKTVLVCSLTRAYDRAFDLGALPRPTRVGLSAALIRRVLSLGLQTPVPTLVRDAAMALFMFLFRGCESAAGRLRDSDLIVTEERVTAVLVHGKGKRTQDPLVLHSDRSPAVAFANSLLALLYRWSRLRLTSDAVFTLAEEEDLFASTASHAVAALTSALSITAPVDAATRLIVRELVHKMSGWRFRSPPLGFCIAWGGRAVECCAFITIRASLSPTTRAGFRSYPPAAMISSPWQGRSGPVRLACCPRGSASCSGERKSLG
jgi:hypothetical protein